MRQEAALTLIELVVVMAILVVLAGIALGRMGHVRHDAEVVLTERTLRVVRDAILGTENAPGYVTDVGHLPTNLIDVVIKPAADPIYDAITKRGWNGPYLAPSGLLSATSGSAAVPDAWRNPIRLQIPPIQGGKVYARLVSGGPNGKIDTPKSLLGFNPEATPEVFDDLVLFLTYVPGG